MDIFLFWLLGSILVAVFASKKGRSGFGWFLFSVCLSPLFGFLFVLILGDRSKSKIADNSLSGKLKELDGLLSQNLISQEEYDQRRKHILES